MKEAVKGILRRFGFELRRVSPGADGTRFKVASIDARGAAKGNVLVSYLNNLFFIDEGEPAPNSHTNYWESWKIAQTFADLGYNVDVIDSYNWRFSPQRKYDIFVGHRNQFEWIAGMLGEDCLKIAHMDTAHYVFNNYAAHKRAFELLKRRRVCADPASLRVVEYNRAVECADFVVALGNNVTAGTFAYGGKPVFTVPISSCSTYPWMETKDHDKCRKNFLWFGSSAMVHKGLDLVLEAFLEMPEFRLTICGPVEKEECFAKAYFKELYRTPNIHTAGWVDTDGEEFRKILGDCIGIVYPSCSEGMNGGVITCMHGGLIPIVSRETGIETDDSYGVTLKDSSIDEIRASVRRVSGLPSNELRSMSRKCWEYARRNHTRENFASQYKTTIETILGRHRQRAREDREEA